MREVIYFDNSATTKPCSKAIENINCCITQNWGNPSSLHTIGINAELALSSARSTVAKQLGCRDDEIVFTSGGTEANNLAILGGVRARAKRGKRIVTTLIEHPSVLNVFKHLEDEGFEVVYLAPEQNGNINENDIYSAINANTIFVSIMLVNNEIGSILPITAAAQAIKRAAAPALLHCDAVQAFGKLPINVKGLGVDLLSISGHKIHGPKGVGALYKAKNVTLHPTVFGGGQEFGVRSGTESLPLICGFEGAVQDLPDLNAQLKTQKQLWQYAKNKLESTGIVKINSGDDALPYILNISVEGYRSETLLHFLDAKGIFVSSGSACAKGHKSYVLKSLGLSDKQIDSALRLSFSRFNTQSEVDTFAAELINATKTLKRV